MRKKGDGKINTIENNMENQWLNGKKEKIAVYADRKTAREVFRKSERCCCDPENTKVG